MKILGFHDLGTGDRLRLSLKGRLEQQGNFQDAFEPFLQALESYAGDTMPDVVRGARQRRYSRASVWKALEERREGNSTAVALFRTEPPAIELSVDIWLARQPVEVDVWFDAQPLSHFAEAERCDGFVRMVRAWASQGVVSYASAHSMADKQLTDAPNFGRDDEVTQRDDLDRVYELFWLNVFGPRLVERVGRERVLSTPAHLVEELPNGAVLLVLRPTVTDFASDEARVAQARAHVHLRPELDFDTVLRTLRERSAALAPVEPRFHPDVAPFLSRLPDEVALGERQRKIAELNAFRPPEPEEWLPVALPPDVEDPEHLLASYADLSEGLLAALHTKVPSVTAATPESLTDLDFYFWREDFPRRYERDLIDGHTAPALGAYLGDVLVRRLGGTWVPRRNPDESQVRVGKRVWLPFLRARRYMQSRQSLLDFSLTQFFKAAERCA
ncbi:hypothetical protein [Myxococcus fulvus]|uniref:hypothetical protein n=1 Tax=Myxococcus fulvus TaxID=33 RepID=UPI0020BDDAA7|nr:hypothetical protein [Myxococcus fulvus]MCK8499674.1 hypothetical protein [Myxococcus fulvus]